MAVNVVVQGGPKLPPGMNSDRYVYRTAASS